MTDSLTPFDPHRQTGLAAPQDNVPRGMVAGRASMQGQANDDQGSIPWSRYISAVKRSWWIILIVAAAGTGAGLYLAGLEPVMYTAETKVMINPTTAQPNAPVGTRPLLRSASQWVPMVRSYSVVDAVVRDLMLNVSFSAGNGDLREGFVLDSAFTPGDYQLTVDSLGQEYTLVRFGTGESETGVVGDSIGRRWGFRWAPPASLLGPTRSVGFNVRGVRETSDGLIGRIVVNLPSDDAQFMTLRFRDWGRERAAQVLNAWTDRFVQTASDMKRQSVVQSREMVEEQLQLAQRELSRAEGARMQFGVNTAGLPGPSGDGGMSGTVLESKLALEDLERNRTRLEALLSRAGTDPIPVSEFWSVPDVIESSAPLRTALDELERLKEEKKVAEVSYGPRHMAMDTLNRAISRLEQDLIPRHTRDVVAQLRIREADLRDRVQSQTAQLRAIPPRALSEARLERDVAQWDAMYDMLKRRSEELKLTDAQMIEDLQRLDMAEVPRSPDRNEAARLLLMAIVASFGAGIALALLRDRLDRRLRYPEQATMELGLTVAGTVPKLRFNRKKELGVTALSQVVESFRAMRLTVRHQFPAGEPVVLCVSSPGAAEGKSLVSSNLAVAFANAGHSTLLIDGDVRRGVVHTTFDVPRRPGLVDHLAGRASADSVIRPTNTPNLSIIPSGTRSKNAPELLVSDAMTALVAAMRERFEVVILDSAPFSAGMDAFALGAAAGTMLVVLRPGVTDRKLAAMKLEVLDRLPVAVVGAVLNGIANNAGYRYYYADYGYADAREWALDDDADDPDAALAGSSSGPRMIAGK